MVVENEHTHTVVEHVVIFGLLLYQMVHILKNCKPDIVRCFNAYIEGRLKCVV